MCESVTVLVKSKTGINQSILDTHLEEQERRAFLDGEGLLKFFFSKGGILKGEGFVEEGGLDRGEGLF